MPPSILNHLNPVLNRNWIETGRKQKVSYPLSFTISVSDLCTH